jgi:hypothetical protein
MDLAVLNFSKKITCFAFHLVLWAEFSTCHSTDLRRRWLDLFCNYYHFDTCILKIILGTYVEMTQNDTSFRILALEYVMQVYVFTTVLFYNNLYTEPCMTSKQSSPLFSINFNKTLLNQNIFQFTPRNVLYQTCEPSVQKTKSPAFETLFRPFR